MPARGLPQQAVGRAGQKPLANLPVILDSEAIAWYAMIAQITKLNSASRWESVTDLTSGISLSEQLSHLL